MNIFYAVQVSNTTVKDGKSYWLLKNDACVNIMRGLVECLIEKDNSLRFIIKLPFIEDVLDMKSYYELFDNKYHNHIEFYAEQIPISPVYSRFNFDFNYHVGHGDEFANIDVMINDENTLTKNWNALFHHLKLNIPIISTNYFLDSPIASKVPFKVRYFERQMESFINSDITTFQCKAGMEEALQAFRSIYKDDVEIKNTSVWGIGVYAKEIMQYNNLKKFAIPTIYFGNRITETAGRYTNWHIYAKAIGLLKDRTDKQFDAVILNPTHKITNEQQNEIMKLSNDCIRIIGNDQEFTRDAYLQFINKAHISCNLFTKEVHGGVTSCEALLSNNIVIMPNINNYKDKFEAYPDYPFLCKVNDKREIDIDDLVDKLKYALEIISTPKEVEINELCKKVGYDTESYEMAAERIINDLRRVKNG